MKNGQLDGKCTIQHEDGRTQNGEFIDGFAINKKTTLILNMIQELDKKFINFATEKWLKRIKIF